MDESRIHGAVATGGQPKRQENSAGAVSAPEAQERVDRWGEVHTVTWDDDLGQWVGEVQGTGLNGQPLRASWPREALLPWASGARTAPAQATSERDKIPADEIPF